MQKFYKYFTLSVLTFAALYSIAYFAGGRIETIADAQTKAQEMCGAPQNVFVIEDNGNRTIHMVYDFERRLATTVLLQKNQTPLRPIVVTTSLNQQ